MDAIPQPDAARRLLDLVAGLGARLDDIRRRLDELDAAIGDLSGARVAAIELAVAGHSRDEAADLLRARHGIADPAPILEDVYGAS